MCCSGKIKAFTLPFAQRLPWGAHLQAAAQRPQPFPSRVVAIPRTPLGLPTDSSLFILPERNEEEYTERLAWHAQDGDQSGSHLFCPHSSGQSRSHDRAPLQWDRECTPDSGRGTGVNTGWPMIPTRAGVSQGIWGGSGIRHLRPPFIDQALLYHREPGRYF